MREITGNSGLIVIIEHFEEDFAERVEVPMRDTFNFDGEVLRTLDVCNASFRFKKMNLGLQYWDQNPQPKMPCCGFVLDEKGIDIYFNINFPGYISVSRTILPAVLSHEFAHLARYRTTNIENNTLLDTLVDEGIAMQFQQLLFPSIDLTSFMGIKEGDIPFLVEEMKKDLDISEDESSRNRWFHGETDLPPYAIYPVSNLVLNSYIKGKRCCPQDLVKINPADVRRILF